MRLNVSTLCVGIPVILLALCLTQTNWLTTSTDQPTIPVTAPMLSTPVAAAAILPAPPPLALRADQTSSVLVYIKLVIDKKYGVLAHLFGGMKDGTQQLVNYNPANPWWDNPLIVHDDPPLPDADVIARADAQVITGQGDSANVTVQVALVPHADISVKTFPPADGIKGTITTTISTSAEYYDGHWTQMVHENDKQVTFTFDTCDPNQQLEELAGETRTISTFAIERYTRDQQKWEPKTAWPAKPDSGDWRVVLYGKDATLHVTSFRYVQQSIAELPE